ncbi:MAG: hypothetical protein ABSC50_12360 [Candidatus Bathyarchaeia archaeon]
MVPSRGNPDLHIHLDPLLYRGLRAQPILELLVEWVAPRHRADSNLACSTALFITQTQNPCTIAYRGKANG